MASATSAEVGINTALAATAWLMSGIGTTEGHSSASTATAFRRAGSHRSARASHAGRCVWIPRCSEKSLSRFTVLAQVEPRSEVFSTRLGKLITGEA